MITSDDLSSGNSALQFTRAAITKNHVVSCVFFFLDAVYTALNTIDVPSDEHTLSQEWSTLARRFPALSLIVCANSGLRRGVSTSILAPGFIIGSLGYLVEALTNADRVITFGSNRL